MPRRWRSSTEAVSKPSGRGHPAETSVPRLTSRLMSAVSPPIDGSVDWLGPDQSARGSHGCQSHASFTPGPTSASP